MHYREGWEQVFCHNCGGHGMVQNFWSPDHDEFDECNTCNGTGSLWKTPNNRLVQYPGGPFCGRYDDMRN